MTGRTADDPTAAAASAPVTHVPEAERAPASGAEDGAGDAPTSATGTPGEAADATAAAPAETRWWPLQFLARVVVAIVVLVFALVGLLTLTRDTPVSHVRALQGDSLPAVDDPLFARTMELYTGVPLRPRNRVELLLNGDGTYPALWEDLRSAERTITVQLYYSQPGAVADTMRAILVERARAGVQVAVLLDAFGSGPLGRAWARPLEEAGARVAWLRPVRWYTLHKASNRSHVRSIVVDGRVGYTGGFGLADYWLGGGRAPDEWRETNVRFWGPAVAQLQVAFAAGWAEATGELITGSAFLPPCSYAVVCTDEGVAMAVTPLAEPEDLERFRDDRRARAAGRGVAARQAGTTTTDSTRRLHAEAPPSAEPPAAATPPVFVREAALLHSVPSPGSTTAERFLALSIASARRTLYVANSYFVPDDHFRGLLTRAAARGVDVRILTAGDSTDVLTTLLAGRASYEELLRGGVRIFEYEPTMMHAKTLVVDGAWSAVGSLNFDNRSLALNDESTLMVLDERLGAQMDSIFLADLDYAREITLEDHLRRSWWQRLLEWGASLASRVL